jgi:hypothetical protein
MLNLCDRLLGLDEVAWSDRFQQEVAQDEITAKTARENSATGCVGGTSPSHPLDSYAGDFEHPAYGIISIRLDGDRLTARRDDLSFSLLHYHYDIFRATVVQSDVPVKLAFTTNVKGDIDSVSIPCEPAVAGIVFKRVPAQAMRLKKLSRTVCRRLRVGRRNADHLSERRERPAGVATRPTVLRVGAVQGRRVHAEGTQWLQRRMQDRCSRHCYRGRNHPVQRRLHRYQEELVNPSAGHILLACQQL